MAQQKNAISRWIKSPLLILLTVIAIGLAGCGKNNSNIPTGPDPDPDPDPGNTEMNIIQVIQEHDDLNVLAQAIVDAGLESTLESDGPFTLLAPVNSAFDNLPDGFIDGLSQDQLKTLINYHLISSEMASDELNELTSVQTVQKDSVFIRAAGGNTQLNGGLSHGGSTFNNSDIEASNGVIHKISEVLLPDIYIDVLAIADKRYNNNLTKFVCECTSGRTGLDSVLTRTDAEFTVFIPTDAAFDDSNVDVLSNEELRDLLEYHIVEEKVLSDDLSDGQTLQTMNGAELVVSVAGDGTISLNEGTATVQEADLVGLNGVVYIIDAVLNPPDN